MKKYTVSRSRALQRAKHLPASNFKSSHPRGVCPIIESHIPIIAAWVEEVADGDTSREFPLGFAGLKSEILTKTHRTPNPFSETERMMAYLDCVIKGEKVDSYYLKVDVFGPQKRTLLRIGMSFSCAGQYLSYWVRDCEPIV